MVRCFFLLIHFLVVEDYELPKSTSHILGAPLTLECVRILSSSIFFLFFFNCLPDDILCKIAIWADDAALNSSCSKPSDLSQQVEIWVLIWSLKYKNVNRNIRKCHSTSNYILIFGKLFYLYKLIHINLKPRILIASFLLTPTIVKQFFCFIGLVFFKKEKKELALYW